MTLTIKTAEELIDPELEARWERRRTPSQADVLRYILRRFIDRAGPVTADEVQRAFPDRSRESVVRTLTTLDQDDLILLRDEEVVLAYPFSAVPTAFTVVLTGGEGRYACCAIDALGIAAMVGQRIEIRSLCHHCREPLVFAASARGPEPDAGGIMVWVGERDEPDRRVCDSL